MRPGGMYGSYGVNRGMGGPRRSPHIMYYRRPAPFFWGAPILGMFMIIPMMMLFFGLIVPFLPIFIGMALLAAGLNMLFRPQPSETKAEEKPKRKRVITADPYDDFDTAYDGGPVEFI